jgi:succinyl-CoA synthetase beta subunit
MNFDEQAAKPLLAEAGIATPRGATARTAEEAGRAAAAIGPVVVKAQVPTGKRGKAGGIKAADSPAEAEAAAAAILGMEIAGHKVEGLLVEERAAIAREFYAAVLTDPASKGPMVMFSTRGGMDIEEVAAAEPGAIRRRPVDILAGFDRAAAEGMLAALDLGAASGEVAAALAALYRLYRERDAELVEINPLVVTTSGRVIALDCKFVLDDSAAARQADLAEQASPEPLSALERQSRAAGLNYIELDGDVGLLANGAGLTMTTMDAVTFYGGRPANFLEIGGEAYTKAVPALRLVLANPRVKSLVVNFCGAFARCDVMTQGVVEAWEALKPELPVFFSIHGTGEGEAIEMVRERLGLEPFDVMDDAVKAAIAAARPEGAS